MKGNIFKRLTAFACSFFVLCASVNLTPIGDYVAGLTAVADADDINWASITNETQFINALKNGGNYRLDVNELRMDDNHNTYSGGAFFVKENTEVVIDLNGHDIILTSASDAYNVSIWLNNNSSLTFVGSGDIRTSSTVSPGSYTRPVFTAKSGTSTLNISDARVTNQYGYIADVNGNCTLNVNFYSGNYSPKSSFNDYFGVSTGGTLNARFTGGHYDKAVKAEYVPEGYIAVADESVANYHYTVKEDIAEIVSDPSSQHLGYTGNPQYLAVGGEVSNGTLMFSMSEDGEFTEEVPKATEIGSYIVYYKAVGSGNTKDSEVRSLVSTIKKNRTITVTAPDVEYTGEPYSAYSFECPDSDGASAFFMDESCSYSSTSAPSAIGKYYIAVVCPETEEYCEVQSEWLTFSITPIGVDYTAPTAITNLSYTGDDQDLVEPGSVDFGTMLYSLSEDGEYSESVPQGADAGDYSVWFKIDADEGYQDVQPQEIKVSIAKKSIEVTLATGNEYVWGTWVAPTEMFSVSGITSEEYEIFCEDIAKCVSTPEKVSYYTYDTSANEPGTYTFESRAYYVDLFETNNPNYDLNFTNSAGNFTITEFDLDEEYEGRSATVTITNTEFDYDGQYHGPSVKVELPYDLVDSNTKEVTLSTKNATINYPSGYRKTDAGEYSTTVTVNNCAGEITADWKINKVTASIDSLPARDFVKYNGQPQTMVIAGESNDGTFMYCIADYNNPGEPVYSEWSEELPTAVEVGYYKVKYKFIADENHTYSDEETVIDVLLLSVDEDESLSELGACSISLAGDIGVNMYMYFADEIKNSATAYVMLKVPKGKNIEYKKVMVSDVITGTPYNNTNTGRNYYPIKVNVAAKDMASAISMQVFDENYVAGKEYT